MAYEWQRWMPDELRAAGLKVVEVEGWRNRGRPASTGHFNPRGLQVTHHTGATSSAANPSAGLPTLINGRSDLPGPLCQTAIDYHGTVYVVAAGRANVNGRKRAVPNWPESDGNEQMGCEVITNGTQPLPPAQVRAIAVHNAVMLRHFGRSPHGYLYRHEDISTSGKWDLGSRSTPQLRADVDAIGDLGFHQELEEMMKVLNLTRAPGTNPDAQIGVEGFVAEGFSSADEAHSVKRILTAPDNDIVLHAEYELYRGWLNRVLGR